MPSVYAVHWDISYWKDEAISISKALKIRTSGTQRQTSTFFSKMFQVMCYWIQYFAELHRKGLETSFEACYITMKDKKPYATGPLFRPAAVKITQITHGKQYGDKVKCIPLSSNTVGKHVGNTARVWRTSSRINCAEWEVCCMAEGKVQMFFRPQFMILARFCFNVDYFLWDTKEKMHQKHSQQITSLTKTKRFTGGDIFSIVYNYFNKNNDLWTNCASKTTEAAAALTTIRDCRVRVPG